MTVQILLHQILYLSNVLSDKMYIINGVAMIGGRGFGHHNPG